MQLAHADVYAFRMFPCAPESVPASRQFTEAVFRKLGLKSDDAKLLVSEAVTNAVVHAKTEVVLHWFWPVDGYVRAEIHDYADSVPVSVRASPYAECGRGIALIQELAVETHVIRTFDGGKSLCITVKEER